MNMKNLSNSAVTKTTEEIEVSVSSRFESRTIAEDQTESFIFTYSVSIENLRETEVRLMRRQWIITDGNGNKRLVQGSGVVGKRPGISPGEIFRYSSYCNLPSPVGAMEGKYFFIEELTGANLEIPIPCFILQAPYVLN